MSAHFEIHVNDMDRAKQFYSKVLGWRFTPMSEGGGDEAAYHLVEGDGIGAEHGLTGGLLRRMDKSHDAGSAIRGCTLTFDVGDVDAVYATALANGGSEALPPTDYPGIGRVAYCEDGQGNVFGFITSAGESE
ncbi:VOC family protein [Pseudohalocynthiibacter aestuariivivens]|uniref:VOC family protein n=1 Tax=Roseovarius pelagicus TaxID=2980108 RepID=A0ABY6D686_9RHOB|nr:MULTISPECIES: VOC family protein [Rhodobacterales]QIE46371.1 VOC family protein [Pseudohalocynthiibacter aestuariivivens]UXX81651.1 VOC family protein [Roseovarius pelagicus]